MKTKKETNSEKEIFLKKRREEYVVLFINRQDCEAISVLSITISNSNLMLIQIRILKTLKTNFLLKYSKLIDISNTYAQNAKN